MLPVASYMGGPNPSCVNGFLTQVTLFFEVAKN